MELLESKQADAVRALKSLKDIQLLGFSEVTRDAAIQRFEYTVEAVWNDVRQRSTTRLVERMSLPP
jgi:hypothetical protein